jgi:tetrachlorobenzoquinone reductase
VCQLGQDEEAPYIMTEPVFPVRVVTTQYEATAILSYVLASLDGKPLPPFEAGSHIDVHLAFGMMRSYSLSNDASDGRYRLTVARDANTKGGSVFMHQNVHAGDTIEISLPRNNFPLFEDAGLSVFIAGGIGVTPFVPMAIRLNALSRPWRLHYCVRTRDRAALLSELHQLADAGPGELLPNFDEEAGGAMLDLRAVLGGLGPKDHIYCCGPVAMLNAFRSTAEALGIPDERVHFEYFSSAHQSASGGGYDLILAKSNRTLRVEEGQTPLKALLAAGIQVSYSCEDGVCGACETRVLDGVPDHRDMILTDKERAEGKSMMVCCSGAKTPSLTLDL